MKAFTQPLASLKEFEDLEAALRKESGILQVSGCIDAQKPHLIYTLNNGSAGRIIVTFSEQKARELYEECRFFYKNAVYYPARDILFYQSDIRGNLLTGQRMTAIKALLTEEYPMVVTTFDALMDRLVPLPVIREGICHFQVGDSLKLSEASRRLVQMGYERESQVEGSGQFAVRGGILDIFPLTEENPYRIELWGDEIDSIRSFDVESQRSLENLTDVQIYPASEVILNDDRIKKGLARIKEESSLVYEAFRKEMKTEEAHRVKSAVEALAEELTTLQGMTSVDSYLTYFFNETVSLLDYFCLLYTSPSPRDS